MKLKAEDVANGSVKLTIAATAPERKALLLGGILSADHSIDPYDITKTSDGLFVVTLQANILKAEELLMQLQSRMNHRPRPYRP